MDYTIILFYKYVGISNPETIRQRQLALCQKLGLTGRIIVAKEGINTTLEGTTEHIEQYIETISSKRPFKNIHFKKSIGTSQAFPRLSVKVRDEIVTLGLGKKDINPRQITGKYLTPTQLHQWLKNKEDIHIVDMRNDYEQKVGRFEGSILPGMENFRDLPKVLPTLAKLRHKKVVTVCTGGVRCEKASGYLKQQGFTDVYQLKGGIVSYMERYVGQHFQGKLYVFDKRITMGFEDPAHPTAMISSCDRCQQPSEHYVNCARVGCHLHFICCLSCYAPDDQPYCSPQCEKATNKV